MRLALHKCHHDVLSLGFCRGSLEECARYLETLKTYEHKPADNIQERTDNDYLSRVWRHGTSESRTSVIMEIDNFTSSDLYLAVFRVMFAGIFRFVLFSNTAWCICRWPVRWHQWDMSTRRTYLHWGLRLGCVLHLFIFFQVNCASPTLCLFSWTCRETEIDSPSLTSTKIRVICADFGWNIRCFNGRFGTLSRNWWKKSMSSTLIYTISNLMEPSL